MHILKTSVFRTGSNGSAVCRAFGLWDIRSIYTVIPRPEAHMHMILFEVFLKNIHLIPQDQIVQ